MKRKFKQWWSSIYCGQNHWSATSNM